MIAKIVILAKQNTSKTLTTMHHIKMASSDLLFNGRGRATSDPIFWLLRGQVCFSTRWGRKSRWWWLRMKHISYRIFHSTYPKSNLRHLPDIWSIISIGV